jgi:hypothetical protein
MRTRRARNDVAKRAIIIWNDFFDWIAAALKVEREEDRIPLAALALATTEGFMLLDALDCGSIITDALEGIKIRSSAST